MRLLQLVFLLLAAASTTASIEPLVGIGTGVVTLGKSLIGLAGVALMPAGLLLPLAVIGPLKVILGIKTFGFLKLALLKMKSPILIPVAAGIGGKLALVNFKAHVAKTAAKVKYALIEAPLKIKAMKIGAIHGAFAGGKAAFLASQHLHETDVHLPKVVLASTLLNRPAQEPEPAETGYGHKAPAYTPAAHPAPAYAPPAPVAPAYAPPAPAAPAYGPVPSAAPAYGPPAPETQYRKRRDAEPEQATITEEAIAEVFDFIRKNDTDFCVRRALCVIAVDPEIAKGYGDDVMTTLTNMRDIDDAPWTTFKQAVITGKTEKTNEACVRDYPTCEKNVEELIEKAVDQLKS